MQDHRIKWKCSYSLLQNRKTLHLELVEYKHSVMINVIDIVRYWNALSSIKRNNI